MDVNKNLKDAAYIGIGIGVIGVQKAGELGEELTTAVKGRVEGLTEWAKALDLPELPELDGTLGERLASVKLPKLSVSNGEAPEPIAKGREFVTGRIEAVRPRLAERVKVIDLRIESLNERIDPVLDDVAGRLPEGAREAIGSARTAARSARTQLVGRISA